MSISTYSELQDALANFTHRADLTSRIPEFIQMGEADLNARIRAKDQEETASYSMSTSVNTLALPAGFMEQQRLEYTASPYQYEEIVFIASPLLTVGTGTGQPFTYTIRDDNMVFEIIPDAAHAVKLYYRKKYDIATDLTNWLLTNYPNLYLMAAMAWAAFYAKDYATEANLRGKLYGSDGHGGEVAVLNRSEARKRGSGGIMQNDLPVGKGRVNILNG